MKPETGGQRKRIAMESFFSKYTFSAFFFLHIELVFSNVFTYNINTSATHQFFQEQKDHLLFLSLRSELIIMGDMTLIGQIQDLNNDPSLVKQMRGMVQI
jgi:hypothetical protein